MLDRLSSRNADWIRQLPKAELHLHLEGSLEPEMLFALAMRNGVRLPFATVDEVRAAYRFRRLDDFLKIYYQGMAVLQTEQDFFELTDRYMRRAYDDGVCHVEVFFDPQGHTRRGVQMEAMVRGIVAALRQSPITSRLIMCFLRDLPESDAFETLASAEPYLEHLTAVGLDSAELGHPPAKFERVFAAARAMGLRLVAHAGEEGPPEYVREALDVLHVDRIDHGNRALEDQELTERLQTAQIALTVCPLSNLKLGGVADLRRHPLKKMLELGLCATVNSDDPAYFGGYVHDNFMAVIEPLELTAEQVVTLARNSFRGSFLESAAIEAHLRAIDEHCAKRMQ